MIASVRGTVLVRGPDHVVVEAGGVGYRLAVSGRALASVAPVGQEALVLAQLVVREDAMTLYGFASEEERALFGLLVGVQGVGPKVALAVLSGGTPRELLNAIAAGDSARFQAVPGIGRRTAERIVVELRPRVGPEDPIVVTRSDDPRSLAREALLGLGLGAGEADALLLDARGETPEELIAAALRAAR